MKKIPCGRCRLSDCRLCWLAENDHSYQVYWGIVPEPAKTCVHIGKATGSTIQCRSCSSGVHLKKFSCAVHGTCTLEKQGIDGTKCCNGCSDKELGVSWGRPPVRHLAYHIYPFPGNGTWQRNIEQLLARIKMFNGRRIVAIATQAGMDAPSTVKRAFKGEVDEFLEIPNEPRLREVATFLPLMERLSSTAKHEAIFYAHAKGVTRPVNDGVSVHPWADLLYESCLDYWPLVERQLTKHPIAGSMKKQGFMFTGSRSTFHYSGAFYWLRSCLVFNRPSWKTIDQQWWGSESWPGLVFNPKEAATLFHEGNSELNLYDFGYLREVQSKYIAWKSEHATSRKEWL